MTESATADTIRRIIALFALLLFAVSWKLWTPQTVFPQIPFFEFLVDCPGWVDWLALVTIGVCLGLTATSKSMNSSVAINVMVLVGAMSVTIVLNQHRLQPWAYQFVVFLSLLLLLDAKRCLNWMRWIIISLYIFSAISKLDYQFVHSTGQHMASTLVGFVGADLSSWSSTNQWRAAISLPIFELLTGILLLIPATRYSLGKWAALLLHLGLILVLGPWGLNHQFTVLIWNAYFVAQTWFLFQRPIKGNAPPKYQDFVSAGVRKRLVTVGLVLGTCVVLFPLTRKRNICDHWPAWEVYSPRASRSLMIVELPIEADELDQFNQKLMTRPNLITATTRQPHLEFSMTQVLDRIGPTAPTTVATTVDGWSLEKLGVPVYPQARFQLACLLEIARQLPETSGRPPQFEVQGVSDRLTGSRLAPPLSAKGIVSWWDEPRIGPEYLPNVEAAERFCRQNYWLNTKPRSLFRLSVEAN